ncbi:hypothetical protein Tcan_12377 [Toxocara canis]|uniref:Uncharacterized protein n=1 Tax=Toxocara canis TaxID=6265 RepID=A0A0B2VVT9_TOXCA|nr:hypothetical protein Tcan_12377 [Toxocara canis]
MRYPKHSWRSLPKNPEQTTSNKVNKVNLDKVRKVQPISTTCERKLPDKKKLLAGMPTYSPIDCKQVQSNSHKASLISEWLRRNVARSALTPDAVLLNPICTCGILAILTDIQIVD